MIKEVKVAQTSVTLGTQKPPPGPPDKPTPPGLGKNYSFVLEEDRGDNYFSRPVSAFRSFVSNVWTTTVDKGVANVRVYSKNPASLDVLGTYDTDTAIYLGRSSETITETLSFSGSKEATLSKGYGLASATVINSSTFYKKDGQAGSIPHQTEKGKFVAAEEVYGVLIVKYTPVYEVYQIGYSIPPSVINQIGQVTANYPRGKRLEDFNLIPITVIATASGGYGATLSLERRMKTPSPENDDTVCLGHWVETGREKNTRRVYGADNLDASGNPIDPSVYIDIEDVTEVTYVCSTNSDLTKTENFTVQS